MGPLVSRSSPTVLDLRLAMERAICTSSSWRTRPRASSSRPTRAACSTSIGQAMVAGSSRSATMARCCCGTALLRNWTPCWGVIRVPAGASTSHRMGALSCRLMPAAPGLCLFGMWPRDPNEQSSPATLKASAPPNSRSTAHTSPRLTVGARSGFGGPRTSRSSVNGGQANASTSYGR